jgi:hypothetical protein
MKIVVARGQHLRKGAADVDVQWRLLIGEILRQPEWKFLADQLPTMTAPLEVRLFKDAFNNIINDICKKMGWGPKYGGGVWTRRRDGRINLACPPSTVRLGEEEGREGKWKEAPRRTGPK